MAQVLTDALRFLYAVVLSQDATILAVVREEFFSNTVTSGASITERAMLEAVRAHILVNRRLPDLNVIEGWGLPAVEDAAQCTQRPEFYLERLKKRHIYNTFRGFNTRMTALMNTPGTNPSVTEMCDHISQFQDVVSAIEVSDRFREMSTVGAEIRRGLEARAAGVPEVFVPFGWSTLDTLTGGASGGDLVYFVARPGVGKTNMLSTMALHAWRQGFKPLLISMEMTDVQISRRIIAQAGGFNSDRLRRGEVTEELLAQFDTAIEAFDAQDANNFYVVSNRDRQTVDSITSLVDQLRPDVIYIDAGYLISTNNNTAKAWEKLSVISENLKRLALSRNIPIILTVQFNRDAAKSKRFALDEIAGSDAIGQLGSIIVAISEGEEPFKDSRRRLKIVKSREGGVAEFDINNQFDPPDFSQIPPEQQNASNFAYDDEI